MMQLLEQMNRLTESFTDDENKLFSQSRFPYIMSKANLYLKIGANKYRKQDFFSMPNEDWDTDDLTAITFGCQQVMSGIGFTPEKPFTGLGVGGFRMLFELFHFEQVARKTIYLDNDRILDKMILRHFIEGEDVIYYNLF